MLLKRFYNESLAQASYLVGCTATGESLVIDPNRDIDQYVRAAAAEGLRISHVTETHIHADFVSGSRELASRTGAELLLSGEGGSDWSYAYAAAAGARLVHGGDSFRVGNVRLDVLHTPGHTPEHLSYLVTDTAGANQPMGMFTGDFIFVGDVGRPDLLERAANIAGTMEASARELYRTLQRLGDLPGYLQLWPGHGAGSACGKSLGAVPSTTLGYERLFSWAFADQTESEFVNAVLAGQPEPPAYFARMKTVNRDGPPDVGETNPLVEVDARQVEAALAAGAWIVDVRPTAAYAAGHIPGTVSIPLGKSFATWAGSLIPSDRDLMLLTADDTAETAERAAAILKLIGTDRVTGWGGTNLFAEWCARGETLAVVKQISPKAVAELLSRESSAAKSTGGVGATQHDVPRIIDVRGNAEWSSGHIPGATHAVLGSLLQWTEALARDTPLITQCQGGSRSSIAASLLMAQGFTDVTNLSGGIQGWRREGLPVELSDV